MRTKDLLIHNGSTGKAVETIGKGLPKLNPKTALAFVIETVNAVNGGALVISSKDKEIFGVFDLIRQKEANGLEGLLPTVHIVPQEDVIGLGGESTIFKKTEEVIVLTVDITADFNWCLEFQKHGL
mmetsp:Transcript_23933/g.47503  ORF Transcript_23933/g.47503 Transcript_23933/m.47503 type:complete len:126 (-) Transcript_23933:355-732(-)